MNDFLPKGYEVPKNTGDYLNKFPEGKTTFRILSPAITGYQYWNKEKKPIRSPEPWDERPDDMQDGSQVRHFWAFIVWNYDAEKAQIMELTQKTIMGPIKEYWENKKWGDPTKYDLVVSRTGKDLNDTEYTVIAEPHSTLDVDVKGILSGINLKALYLGEDPFTSKASDIRPEDVGF